MRTKQQVYEALRKELYDALPEIAHKCDVSIEEALCDKWSKEYVKFHAKSQEKFELLFGSKED